MARGLFKTLKHVGGYFFPALPESDRRFIVAHARSRGILQCNFTKEEYEGLRGLALEFRLKKEIIDELDKDYSFMYQIPKAIRAGRMSAITGMCFDIAIRDYAHIALVIDKIGSRQTAASVSAYDIGETEGES